MSVTNIIINMLLSFQLIGDYFLFMAEALLLLSIHRANNCTSISVKSQILSAVVFTIRYTDLAISYLSIFKTWTNQPTVALYVLLYNFVKISHIFITYWTLLITFIFFRKNEDRKFDTFRYELLIIICALLALVLNYDLEIVEVLWTFSFYLEAVAIIPQSHLISEAKQAGRIVFYYVGLTSFYKLFYMTNWIYSSLYLGSKFDKIAFAAGIVQLIIYVDFFINNRSLWKSPNAQLQFDAQNSRTFSKSESQSRDSSFCSDTLLVRIKSTSNHHNKFSFQTV